MKLYRSVRFKPTGMSLSPELNFRSSSPANSTTGNLLLLSDPFSSVSFLLLLSVPFLLRPSSRPPRSSASTRSATKLLHLRLLSPPPSSRTFCSSVVKLLLLLIRPFSSAKPTPLPPPFLSSSLLQSPRDSSFLCLLRPSPPAPLPRPSSFLLREAAFSPDHAAVSSAQETSPESSGPRRNSQGATGDSLSRQTLARPDSDSKPGTRPGSGSAPRPVDPLPSPLTRPVVFKPI